VTSSNVVARNATAQKIVTVGVGCKESLGKNRFFLLLLTEMVDCGYSVR
jgi:hypothetical protein